MSLSHLFPKAIRALLGIVLVVLPVLSVSAAPGQDGSLVVTAPNTVVNRYAMIASNVTAGATSIPLTNVGGPYGLDPASLKAGDRLMLIQMQRAIIDTTDAPGYGAVTNYNGAGAYEFVDVVAVNGNTVTITGCGLRNSYPADAKAILVPQYTTLTVEAGGSLTAPAWNSTYGGIVAVIVQYTATITGEINVNGLGFRGGVVDNESRPLPNSVLTFRSADTLDGVEKGESIAGLATTLTGGQYGRGAPANGGGGGNSHNAGGGGGANGDNGNPWTGYGVMPTSVTGAAAWQLDPGYAANGNAYTTSSGGGRGGYSFSNADADALTQGPGNAAWGGDLRQEKGGRGGHPVNNNPASRLFLGGGGGAGDSNDWTGGSGGRGGGLVFLYADTVNGTGAILANGDPGVSSGAADAAGGGGAGGTVVVRAATLSGISISANGGVGGNHVYGGYEAFGPGGGGGGGYIATAGGAVTRTANGGSAGTTGSFATSEFPVNGATDGASGQANELVGALPGPGCTAPTLSVTNSPVTYNGSPQAANVSASVPGTVSNVRYNNSATVPTEAGIYAVTADFVPIDTMKYNSLTGAPAGNFVINRVTPTLSVTNSPVTYNGAPQAASVSGSVPGVVSSIRYNGLATVPTDANTYAVTADFAPTDTVNYNSLTGASAGNFVIAPANTTTSLASSRNPSVLGQSVTFTATVAPSSAAGTVQFYADGVALGHPIALSAGTASKSTASLSPGSHAITASYSGGSNYSASTSGTLTQKVRCTIYLPLVLR